MKRSLILWVAFAVTWPALTGCDSLRARRTVRPRLLTTIKGTMIDPGPAAGDSVFATLADVTAGNTSITGALIVQPGEYICTQKPLLIRIQYFFQDFFVLFGPNPGDAVACGFVTAPPATFNLVGSWGFFWGTLPQGSTELIMAHTPGTSFGLQVTSAAVHRVFHFGPNGANIGVRCNVPGSSVELSPPLNTKDTYTRTAAIPSSLPGGIDCSAFPAAQAITTLPAADQAEIAEQKDQADKANWDPLNP